jgi:hypothetical protein
MEYIPPNIGNNKLQMYNPNQHLMEPDVASNIINNRMQPYSESESSVPQAYNYENFEGYRVSGRLELPNGNNLVLSSATENIVLPMYGNAKSEVDPLGNPSSLSNSAVNETFSSCPCGCGAGGCRCPMGCPCGCRQRLQMSQSQAGPVAVPVQSALTGTTNEGFACGVGNMNKYARSYDDENTLVLSNGADAEIVNQSGVHNVTCTI